MNVSIRVNSQKLTILEVLALENSRFEKLNQRRGSLTSEIGLLTEFDFFFSNLEQKVATLILIGLLSIEHLKRVLVKNDNTTNTQLCQIAYKSLSLTPPSPRVIHIHAHEHPLCKNYKGEKSSENTKKTAFSTLTPSISLIYATNTQITPYTHPQQLINYIFRLNMYYV